MRRMSWGKEQGGQLLILLPFFLLYDDIFFSDVNIVLCVCMCVHHWRVQTAHGRNTLSGRKGPE